MKIKRFSLFLFAAAVSLAVEAQTTKAVRTIFETDFTGWSKVPEKLETYPNYTGSIKIEGATCTFSNKANEGKFSNSSIVAYKENCLTIPKSTSADNLSTIFIGPVSGLRSFVIAEAATASNRGAVVSVVTQKSDADELKAAETAYASAQAELAAAADDDAKAAAQAKVDAAKTSVDAAQAKAVKVVQGPINKYSANGVKHTVDLANGKWSYVTNPADPENPTESEIKSEDVAFSDAHLQECYIMIQAYYYSDKKEAYILYLKMDAEIDVPDNQVTLTAEIPAEFKAAGTIRSSLPDTRFNTGTEVTLTATEKLGYKFLNWTVDGEASPIEENPHKFTLNTDTKVTANYKQLITYNYSFAFDAKINPEDADEPETQCATANYYPITKTLEDGESFDIPAMNNVLYKEGYTMVGWSDGTKDYKFGDKVTPKENMTLKPKFVKNTASLNLADTETEMTVRWTFNTGSGAQSAAFEGSTYAGAFWVGQATVGTEIIDVKMPMDVATRGANDKTGKFNNQSNPSTCQVNPNTAFTVPAAKGMKIRLSNTNVVVKETTIDGEAVFANNTTDKLVKYTYNGDKSAIDIVVLDADSYYDYIEIAFNSKGSAISTPAVAADGMGAGDVYNLLGQKVGTNGNLKGLPKGIYIMGGRKFIVR